MRFTLPSFNRDGDWRGWFAWRPVLTRHGCVVWLERIWRRRRYSQWPLPFTLSDWEYQTLDRPTFDEEPR